MIENEPVMGLKVLDKPIKSDKNIILTMSLLMRLFEWAKEDAVNDVALHKAMEKIVAFSDGVNPLSIDTYECIIDGANDNQQNGKEEMDAVDNYNCYANDSYEDINSYEELIGNYDCQQTPTLTFTNDGCVDYTCQDCCQNDTECDDEIEQIVNLAKF